MTENKTPQIALFVCFDCLSNAGALTGLAGLEVVHRLGPEKVSIFCLGGLATEVPTVLEKTRAAERIVTVDGCPMNCALKIVERAGFTPDRVINLVQDCGLKKGPPLQYDEADLQVTTAAVIEAVQPT
jgi:uncharacterized metal-binding protein